MHEFYQRMRFLLFQRNPGLLAWMAQGARQQLQRFSPKRLIPTLLEAIAADRLGRSRDLGLVPDAREVRIASLRSNDLLVHGQNQGQVAYW